MKKVLISGCMIGAILALSACSATDGIYGTAKAAKNVAEKVVPILELDDAKMTKLKLAKTAAETYDEVRTIVRKAQDEKKPIVDGNSTGVMGSSSPSLVGTDLNNTKD